MAHVPPFHRAIANKSIDSQVVLLFAVQDLVDNWSLPQPPAHPWTVAQVLASQEAAGRRIGLMLDLSNHDTLYTEDIPPGVQHRHIKLVAKVGSCLGHRSIHGQ